LSYLAQTQPEPVELGANGDLMYTTQHRGQYRYGISELSTDNAYGTQHQNSARQQQPDNGSLNYLNSQGSPGNSHQTVSSDSPLSEDRYGFNPLLDESYQNISSPVSDDLSDPEPQASNYDYPARYYIPSTVSGASTDDSVENSIFSRTSAYPSRDNSMSSSELGQTVADMALAQGYTYLDETNRTCSEPDEIESLSSPSTDICDEFHRPGGIWDTRYDNGVYLKDVRSVYPSYTTGMSPQEGNRNFQISRKPVPLSVPSGQQSLPTFCPEIKYSPHSQSSVHDSSHSTHEGVSTTDECTFCEKFFMDRSNLKRHELGCKKNPVKLSKRYICKFPGCGKRYTRSDALRVHQRGKGHQGQIEFFC